MEASAGPINDIALSYSISLHMNYYYLVYFTLQACFLVYYALSCLFSVHIFVFRGVYYIHTLLIVFFRLSLMHFFLNFVSELLQVMPRRTCSERIKVCKVGFYARYFCRHCGIVKYSDCKHQLSDHPVQPIFNRDVSCLGICEIGYARLHSMSDTKCNPFGCKLALPGPLQDNAFTLLCIHVPSDGCLFCGKRKFEETSASSL